MRRLGETLAEQVRGQLIVATHSSDILRGFLEGTKGNVRVLRIQREEGRNRVTEARAEVVRELWQKPDLRYSNALEGLFHEQTIICEDDSDCRLLNAMADHLASKSTKPWKDTAYVPTGGKKAIAKIAGTLHRIGVPVKAVFDLDFLSDEGDVRNVVKAFGGEWGAISDLYRRVNAAVRDGCKPKSALEIKSEIITLLENSAPDVLPRSDVSEAMKQTAAWHNVKRFGEVAIPSGEIRDVYSDLIGKLESLGIFLIPVGEIEKFCPTVGLHGPKFVTKLLEGYDLASAPLSGLRAFVEHVHLG